MAVGRAVARDEPPLELNAPQDEGVIMRILGHKTREIFKGYNIVNEDDLRRAAERVTAEPNAAKTGQIVAIDVMRRDRDI